MNILAKVADERVAAVRCEDEQLIVSLEDGRTIAVPLDWYPRLKAATPDQRANWEKAGGGYGIHWPDLDEDLSSEGLLRGAPDPSGRGAGKQASQLPSNFEKVTSSAVEGIAYDEKGRNLDIWYRGGERYSYAGVPPEVYEGLRGTPSIGAFVNELIKPLYAAEQKTGRRRPQT
jgi:hypothetical protein